MRKWNKNKGLFEEVVIITKPKRKKKEKKYVRGRIYPVGIKFVYYDEDKLPKPNTIDYICSYCNGFISGNKYVVKLTKRNGKIAILHDFCHTSLIIIQHNTINKNK